MNDVDPLLTQTAAAIFATDAVSDGAAWSESLARALDRAGLTGLGVDDELGGSGGTAADAADVVRLSGYYGARIALAERLIVAGPHLARAGLRLPGATLTVVPEPGQLSATRAAAGWTVSGTADQIPWGRAVEQVCGLAAGADGPVVVFVRADAGVLTHGANLAGEPRDTITFRDAPALDGGVAELDGLAWRAAGALARSLQIAGALERVLELAVSYANVRVQFGRPLARFQAVRHLLARLAEAAVLARMAAESAARTGRLEDLAFAKIAAGEAATTGSALAHQVFGAIGVTEECDLQRYTRRLWSWRDEFGGEAAWARWVGARIGADGPEQLWPRIAR